VVLPLRASDLDSLRPTQILSVKKKIEAAEKHDHAWQRLIFAGKILNDDAKVADYNINENDFLVLMVRKVCYFFYAYSINK
jgi:UV excision repair protein RAD23